MDLSGHTVFIFNSNDADSIQIAADYKALYPSVQTAGIACSSDSFLPDYATFNSDVETPAMEAIATLQDIYVVILGHKVPLGFYYDDPYYGNIIISSCSRLARMGTDIETKRNNYFYNRKVYEELTASDFTNFRIVSHLFFDTYEKSQEYLLRCSTLNNSNAVTGKILVENNCQNCEDIEYSNADAFQYYTDVKYFTDYLLPDINLENTVNSSITNQLQHFPYIDEESFFWGNVSNSISETFFLDSSQNRFFFWNSYELTVPYDLTNLPTIISALNKGYIGSSISLGNDCSEFLRPEPFFSSLINGATLGESFWRANPFTDTSLMLLGDPLSKCDIDQSVTGTNDAERTVNSIIFGWENILENTARILATRKNKEANILQFHQDLCSLSDYPLMVEIVDNTVGSFQQENYRNFEDACYNYPAQAETYSNSVILGYYNDVKGTDLKTTQQLLTTTGIKISSLLQFKGAFSTVLAANKYTTGSWTLTFPIKDLTYDYADYYFEIEIATEEDPEVLTPIVTINMLIDEGTWKMENDAGKFDDYTENTISSQYIGRNIRFISSISQSLTTLQKYYFKITQYDLNGNSYSQIFTDVIWT
jgi:hypothetical protein